MAEAKQDAGLPLKEFEGFRPVRRTNGPEVQFLDSPDMPPLARVSSQPDSTRSALTQKAFDPIAPCQEAAWFHDYSRSIPSVMRR